VRVTAVREADEARFLTGEAVYLDVRVARLGSRVLARLIDTGICAVLLLVFGLPLTHGDNEALARTGLIITIVVVVIGYPVLLETLLRGRTVGKLALGLRVVREDGGPVTFRHALVRGLVGAAIEFPGLIGPPATWLVTLWTMVGNPQGRRIGDLVAGTLVIHERTPAAWGWVPTMPSGLEAWAATLDLTGLSDDLALTVRHYLARNRQIREPFRTQLGRRLAGEVATTTNPPSPPNVAGWAYLAAVHSERHRRALRQLETVRERSATLWPDLRPDLTVRVR
jgi:uncharacterized RDD family membrane protein YckC